MPWAGNVCFLGLDPGNSSGSVVALGDRGEFLDVLRLPKATAHDVAEFVRHFHQYARLAVLERVSAMPRQGVSSSFKFGVSYGELRMALAAVGVPFEEVPPAKWQKTMCCRSGGDKNITKAAAQRLFPGVKVTHGIADGLLLAEYARRLSAERAMRDTVRDFVAEAAREAAVAAEETR